LHETARKLLDGMKENIKCQEKWLSDIHAWHCKEVTWWYEGNMKCKKWNGQRMLC
jgi:hypothetical protein